MQSTNQIKWHTKNGETVSFSNQHNFFIVDYTDGKFLTVHSTTKQMLKRHPKKDEK
jgi:hypothetical protein